MRYVLSMLLVVGLAFPCDAHPLTWPTIAVIAGETADTFTTLRGMQTGRAVELNPVMQGGTPMFVATKAATTVVLVWAMHRLSREGHPTAARRLGWIAGASFGTLAANNARVGR